MRVPLFVFLLLAALAIGCANSKVTKVAERREEIKLREPVRDEGMSNVPSVPDEDKIIEVIHYPVIIGNKECAVETLVVERSLDYGQTGSFVNAANLQSPVGMVVHLVKKNRGVSERIEHQLSEFVTCPYCPDHDWLMNWRLFETRRWPTWSTSFNFVCIVKN